MLHSSWDCLKVKIVVENYYLYTEKMMKEKTELTPSPPQEQIHSVAHRESQRDMPDKPLFAQVQIRREIIALFGVALIQHALNQRSTTEQSIEESQCDC